MKAAKEHKPQQSRVIQYNKNTNKISSKITPNVVQKILITDVPANGDFSTVTDLGIWWAMAAEYHFQQRLNANAPNPANLNPLDYIHSLHNYVNPQNLPGPINVAQGDRLRMLTHGYDPAQNNNLNYIHVNGGRVLANNVVNNINTANPDNHVTPLYCFMGNNPQHRNLIPGIGNGPLLSPSMGTVSLNINNIPQALQDAGNQNPWGHIIDNNGQWIPINEVPQLRELFYDYIISVQNNGVNSPLTTQHLIRLLIEVYNTVNEPYNAFARYLLNYRNRWWQRLFGLNAVTGRGRSLWP